MRTLAPEAADRPFHFWFSTTSTELGEGTQKHKNFVKIEKKVAKLENLSNGLLKLHFNENASIVLNI